MSIKCLFLSGNDLVEDLNDEGAIPTAWEDRYIQVEFLDTSHGDLLGSWNPSVQRTPDDATNLLLQCSTRWLAQSHCNPKLRHIDMVTAQGSPGTVAEFLGGESNCDDNMYPYTAAVYNNVFSGVSGGQVVYLPLDLGWVADDTRCGGNGGACSSGTTRSSLLRDVLNLCGQPSGTVIVGVPESSIFTIDQNIPNPFNPLTTIEYSMPERGRLQITIYNLRGELVRTLIDEVVNQGPGSMDWDGNDNLGAAVSSGVYFYKAEALGKATIHKMALVR